MTPWVSSDLLTPHQERCGSAQLQIQCSSSERPRQKPLQELWGQQLGCYPTAKEILPQEGPRSKAVCPVTSTHRGMQPTKVLPKGNTCGLTRLLLLLLYPLPSPNQCPSTASPSLLSQTIIHTEKCFELLNSYFKCLATILSRLSQKLSKLSPSVHFLLQGDR